MWRRISWSISQPSHHHGNREQHQTTVASNVPSNCVVTVVIRSSRYHQRKRSTS